MVLLFLADHHILCLIRDSTRIIWGAEALWGESFALPFLALPNFTQFFQICAQISYVRNAPNFVMTASA
jgi:hypothetical protein